MFMRLVCLTCRGQLLLMGEAAEARFTRTGQAWCFHCQQSEPCQPDALARDDKQAALTDSERRVDPGGVNVPALSATIYVHGLTTDPAGNPITRTEKLVLFVLASCIDNSTAQGSVSGGLRAIAARALLSKRGLIHVMKRLQKRGLLDKTSPYAGGSSRTNVYRFLGMPLAQAPLSKDLGGASRPRPCQVGRRPVFDAGFALGPVMPGGHSEANSGPAMSGSALMLNGPPGGV